MILFHINIIQVYAKIIYGIIEETCYNLDNNVFHGESICQYFLGEEDEQVQDHFDGVVFCP